MDSPATQAYLDYLSVQQDAFMADMDRALGRRVEVQFQYLNVLNQRMAMMETLAHLEYMKKQNKVLSEAKDGVNYYWAVA